MLLVFPRRLALRLIGSCIGLALVATPALAVAVALGEDSSPMQVAQDVPAGSAASGSRDAGELKALLSEALERNPEIRAALNEREAAQQRVAPVGTLEDPMLEFGVVNAPIQPLRLNTEDMTMKMLGISQKLPFPGKRDLRQGIAAKNAASLAFGYEETVSRVMRDVSVAYYDLALIDRSITLLERNRLLVGQILRIAESRYTVGQGAQADVLRAQTQLAKMTEELVRMGRERRVMAADLVRLLGRSPESLAIRPEMPQLKAGPPPIEELRNAALKERPQLLGLQSLIDKNQSALDLARKEYYPDFDVRFSYGQRDKTPDGMPRSDMISLTVAINLPLWQKNRLDPMVAEAQAMRGQAISMYEAQRNEVFAKLDQQVAIAEQSRESVTLYETSILPQARLAVQSAIAAYQVNRVDFSTLLDSQMAVLGYEVNHAAAVAAFNKALAEIDQLTGKSALDARSASSPGDKQ